MIRFILTALLTGVLFGVMDGLINGNPFASKLLECYNPMARQSVNIPVGLAIDLVYGFIISGIFLVIIAAMPAGSGMVKGLYYGLAMWFFRVVMSVVSSWMMFNIPPKTLVYVLVTGLFEMLILGLVNGLLLKR